MTAEQIISDIKAKNYKPVYLLMGEEPYYIDRVTDYFIKNVLNESEKAFNQVVLYGKDTDAPAIINTAKRYPMMSSHQVVIVKEAQTLKDIDDLIHYTNHPLSSTLLVINYKYKKLDKRKALYKSIEKNGVILESNRLYDDKIPDWINAYLATKGIKIQPSASVLLTEFLGNDLSKIVNELEKLIITLESGNTTISPAHIEKNIGISKDYNNFELQNALIQKDVVKAYRIIDHFDRNQRDNPFVVTISVLYAFFSKLLLYFNLPDKSKSNVTAMLKINPFFVKDYLAAARSYPEAKVIRIISLLREYDLKSKGVGNVSASPGDLLKELIYKILH
ncbi:MAG: DNA polymerase III subunit delta [Bacteroidales bacterium]|nr:DNA polymerase III subunit delta [Bacteroidales bacterium]